MRRDFAILVAAATAAVVLAAGYGHVVAGRAPATALPAGAGIPALEAAAASRPDDAAILKRLAQAYRREGRADAAVATYVAAARLAPGDPEINAALRDLVGARR